MCDGDSNTHGNSGVWQCVMVIAILMVIVECGSV